MLGIWLQASCLCIAVLPTLGIKLGFAAPSPLARPTPIVLLYMHIQCGNNEDIG